MRSATQLFALAAPIFAPLAAALPMGRRQISPTDLLVVNFAQVLEQLEAEFYKQAIAKFKPEDFTAAGYTSPEVAVEQLLQISGDESIHETVLASVLTSFGAQPLTTCQFKLEGALTDVATTMTVARAVEMAGVSAYLGAAHLLSDPRLLTSAASILTNEARHQSMLNILNGGASIPQAFDIPLSPNAILAIAGPFITDCDLGIKGNAPLTINANDTIGPGTLLTFASPAIDAAAGQQLHCQMVVGGATAAISLPIDRCIVPPGVNGPVAVFITSDDQPLLASDIVDQASDRVVAGPNYIFADFGVQEQTIARLILKPDSPLNKDLNGTPPQTVQQTNTISPEQASSSISSAEQQTGAATASPPPTAGAPAPAVTTTTFLGNITPKVPSPTNVEAPAAPSLTPLGSEPTAASGAP